MTVVLVVSGSISRHIIDNKSSGSTAASDSTCSGRPISDGNNDNVVVVAVVVIICIYADYGLE